MRLGITAIIRDREPWIKEWIAFHYLVGFRKFYIYTHKCKDNTLGVCKELERFFDIKGYQVGNDVNLPQFFCYNHSYAEHGHEVDWMAFIDGDEFLFPTNGQNLENVLERYFYSKLSAIGVYWSCFGSNGHVEEPSGLVIENYRCRGSTTMPSNSHVKSIVLGRQGLSVKSVVDPHVFQTPLGTFDENFRPIESGLTSYQPTYDFLRINHYITQSRKYYLNVKKHGDLATDEIGKKHTREESWWLEHDRNDVYDNSVEHFVQPLKNLLRDIDA